MLQKIMKKLLTTIKKNKLVPTHLLLSDHDIAGLREELEIRYDVDITELYGIKLIIKPDVKMTFYYGNKILG